MPCRQPSEKCRFCGATSFMEEEAFCDESCDDEDLVMWDPEDEDNSFLPESYDDNEEFDDWDDWDDEDEDL